MVDLDKKNVLKKMHGNASTLFALVAYLLHRRGLRCAHSGIFLLSGACLGMAIGIRLSFAPLMFPFLFAVMFFSTKPVKTRARHVLAFGIGGLLVNIPALYFLMTDSKDFIFGNIGYARLNTLYRKEMPFTTAMTLTGKVQFLIKIFFGEKLELPAVLSYLNCAILCIIDRIRKPVYPLQQTIFLLLCFPFIVFGCFAPTPSWFQYYFVMVPFILLLSCECIAGIRNNVLLKAAIWPLMFAAVVLFLSGSPLTNISTFKRIKELRSLVPFSLRAEAEYLRKSVKNKCMNGKVLTLSPLSAVIAKLPVYEEFVTGPFAWRVSHLLPEKEASERGMPLRSRIQSFIKEKTPCAILTGKEDTVLEQPIIQAAKNCGYKSKKMSSGVVIWLPGE